MNDSPRALGIALYGAVAAVLLVFTGYSLYVAGANDCLKQRVAVCVGKIVKTP